MCNTKGTARARLRAKVTKAVLKKKLKARLEEGGIEALLADVGLDSLLGDDALELFLTDEELAAQLTEALSITRSELAELNALHSSADADSELESAAWDRPETFVLSLHPKAERRCLCAWTFEELAAFRSMLERRSLEGEDVDHLIDRVISTAEMYTCDADGRIAISASLREKARLKEKILFVGRGRKFEIWNPTLHEELEESQRRS